MTTNAPLAFYFDATPTVIMAERENKFMVGDALGRIHFLEVLGEDDACCVAAEIGLRVPVVGGSRR